MFVVPKAKQLVQVGESFNRLTVVGIPFYAELSGQRHQHVVCECLCGTVVLKAVQKLKKDVSCGCYQRELSAQRRRSAARHGQTKTRLHNIWTGMRARCSKEYARGYIDYGGRGIRVCEEWNRFESFRDWALTNGYHDGLSIERIDPNGNYEPTNCKWETQYRQMQNRRNTLFVYAFGERKSLSDWSKDSRCTVGRECLRTRLRLGWNPEQAIVEHLDESRSHATADR